MEIFLLKTTALNSKKVNCAVMFSIRPEFTEKIFTFEKKYEFRKVRCRRFVRRAFIYESRGLRGVIGEFEISNIYEGSPQEIWALTKDFSGISLNYYMSYFKNLNNAIAYEIRNPIRYTKSIPLKEFGVFNVPQSFIYIDSEQVHKVVNV